MKTATPQTALTDHAYIPGWCDGDGCPQHGSKVKKTYTFGMNDAEVTVFQGCKCAVCTNVASQVCGGLDTDVTYHVDYRAAAGRARLISLHWQTW